MWKVIDNLPDASIGYRAILDSDGTIICHPSPMGESNARLIAAAPDMLDLLYIVLPYIEDAEHDPAYKAGAVAKVTKQIRATIAKAEGN